MTKKKFFDYNKEVLMVKTSVNRTCFIIITEDKEYYIRNKNKKWDSFIN